MKSKIPSVKLHFVGNIIYPKEVHQPKSDGKRDERKRLPCIWSKLMGKESRLDGSAMSLLKIEAEKLKPLGKLLEYFEKFHLWAVYGHTSFKSHK